MYTDPLCGKTWKTDLEAMASLDNNPSKRKRPDDSPEDLSKSVDVCRHCNKKCAKRSEAVQCDLCYSWLHASCEGLNKDQYKLLTQLLTQYPLLTMSCIIASLINGNPLKAAYV